MMLAVEFSRQALKFLEKSETTLRSRLCNATEKLGSVLFPSDAKRVENQFFEDEKIFRIRVGDYRILYCVNYEKKRVLITKIDKRSNAY